MTKELDDKVALDAAAAGETVSTVAKNKPGRKPVAKPTDAAKKVLIDSVTAVDLTDAERTEISAQAAQELAEEMKADARLEFKKAEKARMKKKALFQAGKDDEGDDLESILIQLAPHMPFIKLDNNVYYPNRMYRLNRKTAAVVKEQMFRGQLHDNEIHGKNMKDFYGLRPRGLLVNATNPDGVATVN